MKYLVQYAPIQRTVLRYMSIDNKEKSEKEIFYNTVKASDPDCNSIVFVFETDNIMNIDKEIKEFFIRLYK